MDYEIRKIYKALESFNKIEGISEIINDMSMLDKKVSEYKNMYRVNAYSIPSIIPDLEFTKKEIDSKYEESFKGLENSNSQYNVKFFGASGDCYERKIESSLTNLGKLAVIKICNHYNIDCNPNDLAGSNADVVKYFKAALEKADNDIIETKMNFKISF